MSTAPVASGSTRRIGRASVWIAGLAALGLIAGCGSSTPATNASSSSSSSRSETATTTPSGQRLSLEANREGELKYDKTSLTANAGRVSIDMTNMSPLGHNVTVESSSGKILGATPTFQGGSKTLTLNLKPGTYKFFCSVPGHRMAGMEGTLSIK